MRLKKFEYVSKFIKDIYINPEMVTSVITSSESENETLIYLTGDEVVRVKGKVEDVILGLTGQRFYLPCTKQKYPL